MERFKLRITNYELRFAKILCVLCVLCGLNYSAKAQSTNQNYPTPVSTNEITGKIPARDIGDARLTNYFYVFINVVTSNFNGDFDVFTAENLKPLTKITVYADDSDRETGRVIYMRQQEKLVLRIEGRSPNDDAAAFRIKFAGSFEPLSLASEKIEPDAPVVKTENQSDVVVNSVGTILEVKPKPTPAPKETIAKNETKLRKNQSRAKDKITVDDVKKAIETKETVAENDKKVEPEKLEDIQKQSAPKVVITDEIADKDPKAEEKAADKTEDNPTAEKPEVTEITKTEVVTTKKAEVTETAKTETPKRKTKTSVKAVSPAELANIKLVVLFKDGSRIERSMSEVLKVNVDKGILTVISKDGAIGRYSILDVEKMTIE